MVPFATPEPPTILFEKSDNLSDLITFHQHRKDIKFYIKFKNPLKILHHLEGESDVTEAGRDAAEGFYPTVREMTSPDHVVTGVEREIHLDAVTF